MVERDHNLTDLSSTIDALSCDCNGRHHIRTFNNINEVLKDTLELDNLLNSTKDTPAADNAKESLFNHT